MVFAKRERKPDVSAGSVFRRCRDNNIVETAKVRAVWADGAGIPHVEFDLRVQQRDVGLDDHRTLSLSSFFLFFPAPVSAD